MGHYTVFLLCISLTTCLGRNLNPIEQTALKNIHRDMEVYDLKTSASAVFPYLSSGSYETRNPADPDNDYYTSEEEPGNRRRQYRNQQSRTSQQGTSKPQPKYDDYYPTRKQYIPPSSRPSQSVPLPKTSNPKSNNAHSSAKNPISDTMSNTAEDDVRPMVPTRNIPIAKKPIGRPRDRTPARPEYKSKESKQRQIPRDEEDKLFVAATGYGRSTRAQFHEQGIQGPNSYKFGYNTGDSYNPMARYEERDDDGYVRGSYSFVDANGKHQVVHYESSPEFGFRTKGGP